MIEINNVEVYGLNESIIASGYPMKSKITEWKSQLSTKDIKRAKTLGSVDIGTGHDNFLQGIIVQFDLTAPIKVWTEAQRYHWLDFVSSQSTMHRLSKMNLSEQFDEYTDERVIEVVKELQQKYNETNSKDDYLTLLMSCPAGLNLTARMTTNYRQLKTIYAQRKDHRLPHWHDVCKFIETLPMAKELGVVK